MTELLHALLKNRYQLGEVIGQGGMATVYQGHDTSLGRDVAIKLFPINSDESELQKQEDEVNVLAGLNHHGLVTLLDAGVDRGRDGNRVFLVMELIQGSDLQKTIAEGPLVPRQIAQIGYDLAEALQYVHHQGVVHRDVKPSNVHFVDYADDSTRARVKLTDFGIAHRGVERLASDSITTGTAAYLSPEQVTRGEVGPQTDIYSLGLVLLECFTGVVAFPGNAMESAAARIDHDPYIPEDVGIEWRMLLTAMTSRDPFLRPIANDLVLALQSLIVSETGRHSVESATVVEATPTGTINLAQILDTPEENAFDRITTMAARILSTAIAIVSIDDEELAWLFTRHGITVDPRVLTDPTEATKHGYGFYAGVPLTARDGTHVGTLCVLDVAPREVTAEDIANLQDLAALAINELELRLETRKASGFSA